MTGHWSITGVRRLNGVYASLLKATIRFRSLLPLTPAPPTNLWFAPWTLPDVWGLPSSVSLLSGRLRTSEGNRAFTRPLGRPAYGQLGYLQAPARLCEALHAGLLPGGTRQHYLCRCIDRYGSSHGIRHCGNREPDRAESSDADARHRWRIRIPGAGHVPEPVFHQLCRPSGH